MGAVTVRNLFCQIGHEFLCCAEISLPPGARSGTILRASSPVRVIAVTAGLPQLGLK